MLPLPSRLQLETVADPESKQRGVPTARTRHLGNCAHAHKIYTRSRGEADGEKGPPLDPPQGKLP